MILNSVQLILETALTTLSLAGAVDWFSEEQAIETPEPSGALPSFQKLLKCLTLALKYNLSQCRFQNANARKQAEKNS